MAEFIKAYCEKSGRYYGMRVEETDDGMRVTDIYDIEPDKAKGLGSTVDVPALKSAGNLLECLGCGSRTVGACACAAAGRDCTGSPGYDAQCMYCKSLRIFSKEEGSELENMIGVGDVVRLAQGQEVVICAGGTGGVLREIRVGVGWEIALQGASMDVDSSVIVSSGSPAKTVQKELVYFGNTEHPSGCVVHLGDNLVGGKYTKNPAATDSENIDVRLDRVPENRDTLYFVLNIYECTKRKQTLDSVRSLYIRLRDPVSGHVLAEYKMEDGFKGKTAVVIGKAYRRGGKWLFKAIGRGVCVERVHDIYPCCED